MVMLLCTTQNGWAFPIRFYLAKITNIDTDPVGEGKIARSRVYTSFKMTNSSTKKKNIIFFFFF
jgi:hypothetical protein